MNSRTARNFVRIFSAPIVGLFVFSQALAAPQALTTTEVRAQFADCGYQLGNPGSAPASQYIVVRDAGVDSSVDSDYRIVMAIVYRDTDVALAAHQAAHARAERAMGRAWPFSDDNGPQLLAGYGGSVWRGNVAIVESDSRTLDSMYAYETEADEMTVARPELFTLGFVSTSRQYAVDRDVVACVENVAPVTAEQPTSGGDSSSDDEVVWPIFLQGRAW